MYTNIKTYSFQLGVLGEKKYNRIIPIFLPFEGCPHRCIFCAQDKQTGLGYGGSKISLSDNLANLFTRLKKEKNTFSSEKLLPEIAFYGGTFTLLPTASMQLCLNMVKQCLAEGLISGARCSTRPDAVSPAILTKLKAAGINLIELGVQSFSNIALSLVRRGYTQHIIKEGCYNILSAGLRLGIQLLPGMPGSTAEVFLNDVEQSLEQNPTCLRFYPCLVVDGTQLADIWRKGLYQPWDINTTVKILGKGLVRAWSKKIPVIRLSLAPEDTLEASILAGPRHPALGSMIQGEALFHLIYEKIKQIGQSPSFVCLPSFCKGFFYGHAGMLKKHWASIGINSVNIQWSNTINYGKLIFL